MLGVFHGLRTTFLIAMLKDLIFRKTLVGALWIEPGTAGLEA